MPYRRKDSPVWWVSYTGPGGKRVRRSTWTTDRREAEALKAKWKLEAFRQQHWDEQPARTFDELMLRFMKETMGRRRTGERRVKVAVKPLYRAFSGRDVTRLRVLDVRAYIRQRREAGLAASTINKEVGFLSAAINHARKEWGWDIPNAAQGQRLAEPSGRVRWITRAEAAALIRAAQSAPRAPHLADFITVALHTGMRKGEILGLEWRRVDLQANLLHLEAHNTKTGRRRSVPLNRVAREAFLSRLRYRAGNCPASPWVFAHPDGSRIQDVKKAFATACRKAGIADFRIHDLRHTCAAWLVSAGVPLTEVRDLLGHSTIKMTERYAHLAPENVRAAVARLETDRSRSGHAETPDAAGVVVSD
jgi:integrase